MQIIVVIIIILALLLVIFTLQNTMDITINIFFWEITEAPLVLVLLSCVFLGYIIAVIYFLPKLWRLKRDYSRMLKFNSELQEIQEMEHKKEEIERNVVSDPEGIELDDDDEFENPFFKD